MKKFYSGTVWFIESRYEASAAEKPVMGSGVVVWLKKTGDKSQPRKYLLTCSHVVRGGTATGPLQTKIACWPPGKGYVPVGAHDAWPDGPDDGTWTAKVFDTLGRSPDAIDPNDVSEADDWVLLDVDDADFQEYPAICDWGELRKGDQITVVGYPGGAMRWITGTPVEPYEASRFRAGRSSDSPGTLKLEGSDNTAPGMSGGGVFEPSGRLVGLHRAQSKETLEFGAVRASHIKSMLAARDFELVPDCRRPRWPRWTIAALTLVIFAILSLFSIIFGPTVVESEDVGLGRDFQEFSELWNQEDPRAQDRISKKLGRYSVMIDWDDLEIVRTEPGEGKSGYYFVVGKGVKEKKPQVKIPLNEGFHASAATSHRTLDNLRGQLIIDMKENVSELTVILDDEERHKLVEYDPIEFGKMQELMNPNSGQRARLPDFEGVHVTGWRIPEPSRVKPIANGGTEYTINHPVYLDPSVDPSEWSFIYIVVEDEEDEVTSGSVVDGTIFLATKRAVKVKAETIRNKVTP